MKEDEVIVVDGIGQADYESLIMDCVKYAIISLPFTVNRMSIPDFKKRAKNIAKGKIAEALFALFCRANNIEADFGACATPFWTVDNRDFLLNGYEWDIKNNFYYCSGDIYNGKYTHFPALIPNRYDGDQWSKRYCNRHSDANGVNFIFTFLKGADLDNDDRGPEFLDINMSPDQLNLISRLYEYYKGQPQKEMPFSEGKFWAKFGNGDNNLFSLHSRPSLVITAYADNKHWNMFKDTGPYVKDAIYRNVASPFWYNREGGAINFLNGTIRTVIKNSTCPVSLLPSFLSLYPHLREKIVFGHIRNHC